MKHLYEVGDRVTWGCQSWKVECVIARQSHILWIIPAYQVFIEVDDLDSWELLSPNWLLPEGALRRMK